jgi:hypothetical protein
MRKIVLTLLAVGAVGGALVAAQTLGAGPGKSHVTSDTLSGYQEVAGTAGLSSNGTGRFEADIDDASQSIDWHLTYSGLSSPATVAHIHFGNRYLSGGVSVFFCGGGPAGHVRPACPAGTTDVADISGTWTPDDIAGPGGQGIPAGAAGWDKFVAAVRAGMTYANVHDATFPSGEIRAQVNDNDQRQPDE